VNGENDRIELWRGIIERLVDYAMAWCLGKWIRCERGGNGGWSERGIVLKGGAVRIRRE